MYNGVMWRFSVDLDNRISENPYYALSPEGQASLYMVKAENERLKRLLNKKKARTNNDT